MKAIPCVLRKIHFWEFSAALLVLSAPAGYALDGTWSSAATTGSWSTSSDWISSNIASGAGASADFSQVNLAGDITVTLDSNYTVGSLVFGDTDTSTAGGWKIASPSSSNKKTLTLEGTTTPTITVNALGSGKIVEIYAVIAGTQGFTKNGTGTLKLSEWNTFTGDVTVESGTLLLAASSSSNGAISALGNLNTSRTLVINNGGTVEATTNNVFNTTTSTDASLAIQVNAGGTLIADRYTTIGNITLNGGSLVNNLSSSVDSGYDGFSFLGTITVGGNSVSSITSVNGRANRIAVSQEIDVADATGNKAADLVVSAPLWDSRSGASSLTKTGAGTMELSGSNTYSGGTVISNGMVLATNANGSALGSGAVNVNAGGTLGGTGFVSVGSNAISIAAGGTLLGGNGEDATGTLTLSGALNMANDSLLAFVLGSNGDHSSLAREAGSSAWTFDDNQTVTFIDDGAQVGTYSNLITGLESDPGVANWVISNSGWTGTFSYADGDVSLTLTAVPEPGAYALLGAGVAAMALLRFGRRCKAGA